MHTVVDMDIITVGIYSNTQEDVNTTTDTIRLASLAWML